MGPNHNPIEALLNEHDVARITGLSVATVRRWRLLKRGPKYIKLGSSVKYPPIFLVKFLENMPTGGGEQEVASLKADLGHG
jgi:predicted DNA-binding transcriptional regulator AlpA